MEGGTTPMITVQDEVHENESSLAHLAYTATLDEDIATFYRDVTAKEWQCLHLARERVRMYLSLVGGCPFVCYSCQQPNRPSTDLLNCVRCRPDLEPLACEGGQCEFVGLVCSPHLFLTNTFAITYMRDGIVFPHVVDGSPRKLIRACYYCLLTGVENCLRNNAKSNKDASLYLTF